MYSFKTIYYCNMNTIVVSNTSLMSPEKRQHDTNDGYGAGALYIKYCKNDFKA